MQQTKKFHLTQTFWEIALDAFQCDFSFANAVSAYKIYLTEWGYLVQNKAK